MNDEGKDEESIRETDCDIVSITINHFFKKCELNFVLQVSDSIKYNYGPRSVAVGHFNNDTWLDIVVTNHVVSTIVVFLGYGNGTFEMQKPYSTGNDSSTTMITVGDFNKDNR
ncbi:unnamed protein product, partial [Rotaria sordida]